VSTTAYLSRTIEPSSIEPTAKRDQNTDVNSKQLTYYLNSKSYAATNREQLNRSRGPNSYPRREHEDRMTRQLIETTGHLTRTAIDTLHTVRDDINDDMREAIPSGQHIRDGPERLGWETSAGCPKRCPG
jgi:hypothetical protein